jgi:hypothetical protein
MNWSRVAEKNWTDARVKQWVCAAVVSRRCTRVNSVSEDTMTQLRGAWSMYTFIRAYHPARARAARSQYGYSRFYEVYKKWNSYEFSPDECIEYLESELSNEAMACQIVDIHDSRDEWERKSYGIYRTVAKFTDVAFGAPAWFTAWAKETRELFERNGIHDADYKK